MECSKKQFDYVLVGNYGYCDLLENAIIHLTKINKLQRKIILYCLDEKLFSYFQLKNYDINLKKNFAGVGKNFSIYNSRNFKIITNKKFDSIYKHLENNPDKDLIYLDGDIIILKEPDNINYDYDIIFSADADGYYWVCTGYMFIQNNEKSKKLLKQVVDSDFSDNDQEILNDILDIKWRTPALHKEADIRNYCKFNDIKLEIFNINECYNGWYLQNRREEVETNIINNKVVSIHANHIGGKIPKIKLLKSYNKWYWSSSSIILWLRKIKFSLIFFLNRRLSP